LKNPFYEKTLLISLSPVHFFRSQELGIVE